MPCAPCLFTTNTTYKRFSAGILTEVGRHGGFCCLLLLFVPQLVGAPRNAWIATWAACPLAAAPDPDEPLLKIEDQTVRERVRVSIGGAQICLRPSNEYGSAALLIGSATVAAPNDPTNVRPGSIQTVTFGGRNSVTIPAGAPVLRNREPVIGVIL